MDWCEKCKADNNWCDHFQMNIKKEKDSGNKSVKKWCDSIHGLLKIAACAAEGGIDAIGKLLGDDGDGGGDGKNIDFSKIPCPKKLATPPPVIIMPSWPHPPEWRPTAAAAATGLSGGAIAGITIGAIFLFLLLLGGCVVLFIFLGSSGKSGKGGSSSNKKSINIVTNVNKDNISKGTALKKKSSKKSGKKSSKKSSKGLVLKKKSSVKTGKSSRKLLILKKRSSQGSSAASSAKGSFAASSAKGSSAASRFSTSGKPSSAGSKKGSSAVSKKSSFASQKGSTKGSFASSKKASSFASSKAPSKAPSKASIKKALA